MGAVDPQLAGLHLRGEVPTEALVETLGSLLGADDEADAPTGDPGDVEEVVDLPHDVTLTLQVEHLAHVVVLRLEDGLRARVERGNPRPTSGVDVRFGLSPVATAPL